MDDNEPNKRFELNWIESKEELNKVTHFPVPYSYYAWKHY